jgi:hypothetical protein
VIYANSVDSVAPIHMNKNTRQIATLELDPSKVPSYTKEAAGKTWMGFHRYYEVGGVIEARYDSALITYTAKLAGKIFQPQWLSCVNADGA